MKVKVENIQIQMTSNEADMLCSVFLKVDWSNFHPEASVTEGYKNLVDEFIDIVYKQIGD